MWENIIVWVIVVVAVGFSLKSMIKIYKGDGGCNCSCSGECSSDAKKGKSCEYQNLIK